MPSKSILFIALFAGFLGLLPHVLYSIDVGTFTGMEYAWDEHTYANYALFRDNETHRLFSAALFRLVYFLCGDDFGLTMALADFLFPVLVAVLAGCFVRDCGFTAKTPMFIAVVLMLFPTALLSFSDINFWGKFLRHVSPFAMTGLTEKSLGLIPYTTVSFLPLYRSPDPQVSMIVQMALILALFGFVRRPEGRLPLLAIAGLCLLLPFIYITQSIGLLVMLAGYGVLAFLLNRDRRALPVLAVAVVGAVWLLFAFSLKTGDSYAVSFIYASHVPVFGASVLWALAGGGYMAWQRRADLTSVFSAGFLQDRQVLALACLFVPVVTLNQQLLTGLMIRPLSWELYANYTFTAAGILLLWPGFPSAGAAQAPWRVRVAKILPLVLALALVCNQGKSYGRFVERNLVAKATAELIVQMDDNGELTGRSILLADPASEAGVRNDLGRSDRALAMLPGHFSLLEQQPRIAKAAENGYVLSDMPMKETGFLLRRLQGETPEEIETLMSGQIRQGLCEPMMQYFFWVRDCWGYLTDFRDLRRDKIKPFLPQLAADYRDFLSDRKRQEVFGAIVYISTDRSAPEGMRRLASFTAGRWMPVTVYAYVLVD